MRYIVDTDIVIDGLHGKSEVLDLLVDRSSTQLAISIISLGELYEGVFGSRDPGSQMNGLREFISGYEVLTLSDAIMETFARERATLRQRGMLIPDMDLLIAATSITHGLTLMTRNGGHFQRIPHLTIDIQYIVYLELQLSNTRRTIARVAA